MELGIQEFAQFGHGFKQSGQMIQHLIMHEKMNLWKISSMKKLITLIRTCMC